MLDSAVRYAPSNPPGSSDDCSTINQARMLFCVCDFFTSADPGIFVRGGGGRHGESLGGGGGVLCYFFTHVGSDHFFGVKFLNFNIFAVTYIRVTRNSNKIPILNSNNTVVYLTQVNEGNSISFIYTIGFYRCFGIHSVISLLFT